MKKIIEILYVMAINVIVSILLSCNRPSTKVTQCYEFSSIQIPMESGLLFVATVKEPVAEEFKEEIKTTDPRRVREVAAKYNVAMPSHVFMFEGKTVVIF